MATVFTLTFSSAGWRFATTDTPDYSFGIIRTNDASAFFETPSNVASPLAKWTHLAAVYTPSSDVTAHALEALAPEEGYERHVERGLDWLLGEQEADGSWFGRWGVNHVYGTGAALPALEACGIDPGHPSFRRAVVWLDSVQNEDGEQCLLLARREPKPPPVLQDFERTQDPKLESPGCHAF